MGFSNTGTIEDRQKAKFTENIKVPERSTFKLTYFLPLMAWKHIPEAKIWHLWSLQRMRCTRIGCPPQIGTSFSLSGERILTLITIFLFYRPSKHAN